MRVPSVSFESTCTSSNRPAFLTLCEPQRKHDQHRRSDQRERYIFRDGTTGKETYPAGRFLYSAMPKDGTVTLDFNKAYNPPCAFSPYATCPLPPKENYLTVRIEAGEKSYH